MLIDLVAPIGWITVAVLSASLFTGNYGYKIRGVGIILLSVILGILTPFLWTAEDSIVESVLALFGCLIGLYIGILLLKSVVTLRRTTIMIISTGLILLLAYTVGSFQSYMIETVASETSLILNMIGFNTTVVQSSEGFFILFNNTDGLKTKIVLACTGIGSIAIFVGLSLSLSSLKIYQRLLLALVASGVIYVLNIARNVFIAAAYGGQLLHFAPNIIGGIFGRQGEWVSYYIADKIISQTASAVFLALFALFIVTKVPEESTLFDEWIEIFKRIRSDCSSIQN